MTKLRFTSIALLLTVAVLALGACGDDEGSGESATTGTEDTVSTAPPIGSDETGTGKTKAETTETETTETGKTNTRKRKRDDNSGSGSGKGSDDSSGSGSGSNSDASPEKELSKNDTFGISRRVCNSYLPFALARELEKGKKSAEDIATDYSKAYPESKRKRAYDGCLAGLKARD